MEELLKPKSLWRSPIEVNEAKIQAILESTVDSIITITETGLIDSVNSATLTLFGYTREELLGKNVKMLMPAPYREEHDQYLANYTGTGRAKIIGIGREVVGQRKDGTKFPLYLSVGEAIFGESRLFTGIIRDLSSIKLLEEESKGFFELSLDMLCVAGFDGFFKRLSPAWEKALGFTAEELTAKPFLELIHPEDHTSTQQILTQLATGQDVVHFENRFRHKTGTYRWLSWRATMNIERQLIYATARDVTQQKADNEALKLAQIEALEASRIKSEFLANMSHEIRTPMNGVIGMTGLLLKTALTPEQQDYVETIRLSGDHLLTIINDILDFSKIEAGKLQLEEQPFELSSNIEEVLILFSARSEEKNIELTYAVDPNLPAFIQSDVTRLRQILANLISNALKFTEAGEISLEVSLQQQSPRGLELLFVVKDTGIGISEENQRHLFQAFVQADASTTRKFGGTGLGLAISLRLAQLMGGKMWVESREGHGSSFCFTIKASKADTMPQQIRIPSSAFHGKRVLLVDDHPINLRMLKQYCKNWGLWAMTANSPQSALAMLNSGNDFDFAILDYQMPEMNGVQLAQQIRTLPNPALANMPLILFSSMDQQEHKTIVSDLFSLKISKPLRQSQLWNALTLVAGSAASLKTTNKLPAQHRSVPESSAKMGELIPLRLLLAEDNRINQKVAVRLLEFLGYSLDVAANGLEVLDALKRQPYDLILMDCQMPEMDGFEATAQIRKDWPEATRPVIVAITANALAGDREKCLIAGMDDYLSKPLNEKELVDILRKWGNQLLNRAVEFNPQYSKQE
ncbi:MAG: PAS domain S-box protein [SAR324 cluster bacterium]|nr:PAS domain S-box protein [SAR324 cluster bacterium]